MTVLGIHHVQVACPAGSEDLLRHFYAVVCGMPEIPKPPVLAARGGVWFAAGEQELHCGVEDGFGPARKAHPCFGVDDVAALAAAIAGAGGEVRWNHEVPGAQRFHTDDPVGNRVEFQQVQPTKLNFIV